MARPPSVRADERDGRHRYGRGLAPLVGALALLAITVCLAAVVAATALSVSPGSTPTTAAFDLSVDADADEIVVEHVAGDAIDVRELSVLVAVDGSELSMQPPVPFVGAEGFDGAPTGPFNAEADPTWRSGERAGVTLGGTNDPAVGPGDEVVVTLSVDDRQIARLEANAA